MITIRSGADTFGFRAKAAGVMTSGGGEAPAFEIEGTGGGRALLLPYRHVVTLDDRFVSLVNPHWSPERPSDTGELEEWQRAGYASTGLAVDLQFEDGTFLSNLGAVDQYGHHMQADRQGAERYLRTDQWNRVESDLSLAAGKTVIAAHIDVVSAPGQPISAQVVLQGFVRAAGVEMVGADLVDTRRGTDSSPSMSRGNMYPCAALPNASAFAAPMTDRHEPGWFYRYAIDAPALEAFTITRLPSPWIGDHGSLQLFPAVRGVEGRFGWHRLHFQREKETAHPHVYAITFDIGISVQLVAAMRATTVHINFGNHEPVLAIGPTGGFGRIQVDASNPGEIAAYSDFVSLSVLDAPRTYYCIIANAPVADSWADADGQQFFRFEDSQTKDGLSIKIGWSYLSHDQARHNVIAEFGSGSLNQALERGEETWNALLGRVTIGGVTTGQRETFYSCLYRTFLFPNIAFDEVDGMPRHPSHLSRSMVGDEAPPDADGPLTVGGGFWDTYRTTWPAYFLIAPSRAGLLLEGIIQHYLDHGWIPRWSGPGPIDCMVGTNSDAVFADADAKGVKLGRYRDAYRATLKNATVASQRPEVGRKGQGRSSFVGFTSTDVSEGLSWTMEGAICDAAIAQWASRLRDREPENSTSKARYAAEARYFANRALAYRNLFDVRHGFFIGRTDAGDFRDTTDFDPTVWGGDYAETNAWGMAHSAPHDGDGLAVLHGGRGGLGASLDTLFETVPPPLELTVGTYPFVIHEMVEARDVRMGLWAPSNQPAHHTPFMYLFSDRPHRTQALVREAVRRLFVGGDLGQGYPGDEDTGEMSAWYLFLSMGLYPLAPGTGLYAITSPSLGHLTIELENGRTLTVEALNNAPENDYIQSVTVNGERWDAPFISHDDLTGGCVIEIELGSSPSSWGRLPDEFESQQALVEVTSLVPWTSSNPTDAAALIDDDSSTERLLEPGWWFSSLVRRQPVVMYTLTSGEALPAPHSWRVQGSDDAVSWVDLDVRTDEHFEWPRMTRPFLVSNADTFDHVRVLFDGDRNGSLSQIELYVDPSNPKDHRN